MILVTGANGFVGTALCHQLIALGASVRGAIRRLERSVSCIEDIELFQVGECDPFADWSKALDGVRAVVHLAARVHVMHEKATDPLTEFRSVNVEGTLNLANQAAKAGVRRFVYLSSIKVNGEKTLPGRPFAERDVPAPLDPYGVSKHEAEEGLRKLAQQTGMEVVIIRPPLVYGKEVKANFLNMMRWLYKGVPLPFGAIHNRRSLVALDNLVDFIVVCLDHPAAANQTFLVSDGEDTSTTELLRRMAIALNVPTRLLPVPQKLLEVGFKMVGKNDLAQRLCGSLQVDIAKSCTVLDWKPLISVDEGLRRTAEYFLRSRG
ncbi:UDP-glucose 4-epimerase family protein [Sulfuricella denitrificans]|nr:SDR family oxidoreductase [Sulfuricella denitrificans]